MESAVWTLFVLAGAILSSVLIYWGQPIAFVLYGVAMTGIGMLTLTGNNVAMDSFGPIADNANGIGEMAGLPDDARERMADLDAVGNTTKAITKGVAIGSAVIAAVSLFGSFLTDVTKVQVQMGVAEPSQLLSTGIRISEPFVLIGLLIGGAIPWLFSSIAINAVSRAASLIVVEVRRQFKIPGVMEGTVKPDYGQAVGICTVAAQKELIGLAVIAVMIPLIVGLTLRVEALGGFLGGVILSGQLLAVFMANSGGAWDNAKKLIETGSYGGRGSAQHKAARRRRHRRRPAQGHGRAGPQPDDQGHQPRLGPERAAPHPLQQAVARRRPVHRRLALGRHRLDLVLQEDGPPAEGLSAPGSPNAHSNSGGAPGERILGHADFPSEEIGSSVGSLFPASGRETMPACLLMSLGLSPLAPRNFIFDVRLWGIPPRLSFPNPGDSNLGNHGGSSDPWAILKDCWRRDCP